MASHTMRATVGGQCHPPAVTACSKRSCGRPSRLRILQIHATVSSEHACADLKAAQLGRNAFPLEAACTTSRAVMGVNQLGFRGLLAATDIAPGDVVLSIPLHNMLQVPRQLTQPNMQSTATAALDSWQQQHGKLPEELLSFFSRQDVLYESKLVAWLLFLRAAAPAGSLWHSYCQSLPAASDAITFCSYSEQHVEQLQFSVWKVCF